MSPIERWYFDCLKLLAAHYKRAPTLPELSTFTGRSITPIYLALRRLEGRGIVRRNDRRRFEVVS